MIVKKEGIINELIYEQTAYHSGEYRIYPTLSHLKYLIDEIIRSKSTTNYIRFTPFYRNARYNQQIEFDDYLFYIECKEQFDDKSLENHIGLCLGKKYIDMDDDEIRIGKILFPICKNNDIEAYKKALEEYVEFLDELIPKLMDVAKSTMKLKDEDLAFGYFCFEIHSE